MTTHRERLQACLRNEILDHPPVALWRHFPVDDQTPEGLAAATLLFQRTYNFDLVKVTPSSSFCLKDWGADDTWRGNPEGTRDYTKHPIERLQDWEHLPVLDSTTPHLAAQLECLRILRRQLGPETPILQTIFSPMAQAKNLAGKETLVVHLRQAPEAVLKALETITETTRRFIEASIETGIDGIFYAVQHAQAGLLSSDEYIHFARKNDLALLKAAKDLWLNLLHIHGQDIFFDQLADYPVQVVNWHDRDTAPSLAEAQLNFSGLVCGGLSRETMVLETSAEVQKEARDALAQTKGQRFILGTGCVVPIIAPHGNILAARQAVDPEFKIGERNSP
jgi:uroporphyrinogen decarboxylase